MVHEEDGSTINRGQIYILKICISYLYFTVHVQWELDGVRLNFILGYSFKVLLDVRYNLDVVDHLMRMTSLTLIYYLEKYVDVEVDAWESSLGETITCTIRRLRVMEIVV